jgi:hypothetical protein
MTLAGNSGVAGAVTVANVVIATQLSRGGLKDLTPGDTEAQAMGKLTISELFAGGISTGNFRLIAPAGVTFNNADAVVTTSVPATAITTTPTITATFSPNDTLVINIAVASSTVSFTPRAVIGPNALGFLSFQVVDGDIDGTGGAGITAETIDLAYANGTLDKFDAGDDVSVNVGFTATNMVAGGLVEYKTAKSSNTAIATVTLSGGALTVKGTGVGDAVITVTDGLDQSDTVAVTVTQTTAQPVSEKVKASDGSTTAATFSSGASSDGGETFAETFTTADNVTVVGTINVDPADQGTDGEVLVAILGQGVLTYLDTDGNVMSWDGSIAGLGAHIVATPLGDVYNITVFNGDTLAAGKYRVALAYSTADGKLIYAPKAIIFTVTAE